MPFRGGLSLILSGRFSELSPQGCLCQGFGPGACGEPLTCCRWKAVTARKARRPRSPVVTRGPRHTVRSEMPLSPRLPEALPEPVCMCVLGSGAPGATAGL